MTTTLTDNPRQNHLLANLPPDDYARLLADLELVSLERGEILYEPGASLSHVYFPTTCVVSLICCTNDGASAEVAMTGNDGLVGSELGLGGDFATQRCVVQNTGKAYRLKAKTMRWEINQGSALLQLSLLHTQALMAQIAQRLVCNRHHSIEQQLCRWLLLSLDRLPGNLICITQEQIAKLLGVRRAAITETSGKLQAAGLIQYSRGNINIVNRPGLIARACSCYSSTRPAMDLLVNEATQMRANPASASVTASLRELAEDRLRQAQQVEPETTENTARLMHELQVHQIEFEMQNDELVRARGEAEAQRKRTTDIYEFAPMGYFTLDARGHILDLNLAGARLLNIDRALKNQHRFAAFVAEEHLPLFNHFIEEALTADGKRICEVALAAVGQRPRELVRIEALPDESGRQCRIVVIDLFAEKLAEKVLFERESYQRALLDNFSAPSSST